MFLSESANWHVKNKVPFVDNIFRGGSTSFFSLIKEGRFIFNTNPNILNEQDLELYSQTDIGLEGVYEGEKVMLDLPMLCEKSEYKGRKVKLNYVQRSDGPKKYKVFVRNPKTGNVVKINLGDVKGGLKAKVSNAEDRKKFASRFNCKDKKDKMTAGYWVCRLNRFGHLFGGKTYPGYW